MKESMLRLIVALGTICFASGFGLAMVYEVTKEPIAYQKKLEVIRSLAAVLPGMEIDPDSQYKDMTGKEAEIMAIHAGLECGIIGDKYPGMDMISFGPELKNPHSPDEKVNIGSVERFWDFVVITLKALL